MLSIKYPGKVVLVEEIKQLLEALVGVRYQNPFLALTYSGLQLYSVLVAGDITRCEYCGRIVSLARSHPAGRKRRRDKRFCDDACRQAHHRAKKES